MDTRMHAQIRTIVAFTMCYCVRELHSAIAVTECVTAIARGRRAQAARQFRENKKKEIQQLQRQVRRDRYLSRYLSICLGI